MSTRGHEKTGKVADARQEVETARQKVESVRAELFATGGDFEDKARALNGALIDLLRKEERFEMVKKKSDVARDDRNIVRVFRAERVRTA